MRPDELLNEETFQEFCSLDAGDGSVLKELFEIFTSSSTERLSRMHQALKDGHYERLRKEAHSLKGAVAHMGGLRLAQDLQVFEKRAKEEAPLQDLASLLEALKQDYLLLNEMLSQRLQRG
jgi:HPt (histidine-containing phosphotransfer) domain-containing protein